MSRLEEFLQNKAKVEGRKNKKLKKTIKDERTGLSFEIEDPDDGLISDFRKKVKDIEIEKVANGDATEKDKKVYIEACSYLIAKCIVDPNLNDEKMKNAFAYTIPYEFILKSFNETEIDAWATEIVGLAKTIKS